MNSYLHLWNACQLLEDMNLAKERIRHGFVHTCSGDPLAKFADDQE